MVQMQKISSFLKYLGGLSLLGMLFLTCTDVVTSFFGLPILGAEELVALWASILLAFSLPCAHIEKANVGVDLLYLCLPSRLKKINDVFVSLLSFVLFSIISWQCFLYAGSLKASGEVTMDLKLPTYYLVYGISFALLILSIVMLVELYDNLKPGDRK